MRRHVLIALLRMLRPTGLGVVFTPTPFLAPFTNMYEISPVVMRFYQRVAH
jgi:hypothetical protein